MNRFLEGSLSIDHRVTYALTVPSSPAPEAGHPVVAALHGKGDDAARLRERLHGWDRAPFAVLWLDAPWPIESGTPPRLGRSWYAYAGDDAAFRKELLAMSARVHDVIRNVGAIHGLDARRPGLFGYSQGGYLAGVAALAHPDACAALAVASARIKTEMFDDDLAARARFPVLGLHGRRDPQVLFERQERAVRALRDAGADASFVPHDGGHGLRSDAGPLLVDFFTRALVAPRR